MTAETHELHASLTTAEALMRARYDAYVRRDDDFLNATWHPDTREDGVHFDEDPGIRWRGLVVIDTVRGQEGDDDGVVEFRAVYITADGERGELHERAYFERIDGLWHYVGDELDDDDFGLYDEDLLLAEDAW